MLNSFFILFAAEVSMFKAPFDFDEAVTSTVNTASSFFLCCVASSKTTCVFCCASDSSFARMTWKTICVVYALIVTRTSRTLCIISYCLPSSNELLRLPRLSSFDDLLELRNRLFSLVAISMTILRTIASILRTRTSSMTSSF